MAAARLPVVHAAVQDRPRVDAARLENAGGDRRASAGVADRHDRLLPEAVVADAQQAVGDVARSRDVAAVAFVLLADVDHLDLAGCEQSLELADADRHELLVARRVERVAGDVEQRHRTQTARGAVRFVDARRVDRDLLVGRQQEGALRRERLAVDRNVDRAVRMSRDERVGVADVENRGGARGGEPLERLRRRNERAAVQGDDTLHVRRPQLRPAGGHLHEVVLVRDRHRMVEAALEADRRRRLRAHAGATQRAGDVAGKDLDAVWQLCEPAERVEKPLGAGARLDREVRARGVPDEERVAREDEPRLVAPVAIADGEGAVLGAVTGRVDRADRDRADVHDRTVVERCMGVVRLRGAVDVHWTAVVEREPAVPGEVVRVRVCLEHAHQPNLLARRLLDVLLDPVRRIDDRCLPRVLVADQIGRAPQAVVHELAEDHKP